jgi:hypothetical protein
MMGKAREARGVGAPRKERRGDPHLRCSRDRDL